jgi:hypothetical protein
MKVRHLFTWLILLTWVWTVPLSEAKKKAEPSAITVQHILIGFKKTVPNKKLDRTKREAQALAEELLQRAQAGEEFEALVREYTDEGQRPDNPHPGLILITNRDAPLLPGSIERDDLAINFADVAFELEVDEIGLAKYHPGNSPYGWHVIKRLE